MARFKYSVSVDGKRIEKTRIIAEAGDTFTLGYPNGYRLVVSKANKALSRNAALRQAYDECLGDIAESKATIRYYQQRLEVLAQTLDNIRGLARQHQLDLGSELHQGASGKKRSL
jgi:hypothetical protein